MKLFSISALFISLFCLASNVEQSTLDDAAPVSTLLKSLGDEPSPNLVDRNVSLISEEIGRDIVHDGFSKGKKKSSGKQSKHFVCTSCHNVVKEDYDLSKSDPESRLKYAQENGIPFLQGTTLYGAVNRTSFYNGDYEKQYGDLVNEARHDIRKAIQLCATECAQGRALKNWEIESILAYLWTIEIKVGDLDISEGEKDLVEKAKRGSADKLDAISVLKSKYLDGSPADFTFPPEDRKLGYKGIEGDPKNGKSVYETSCLHCHQNQRYSYLHLDDSKLTLKWLKKKADTYSRHSIYQVVRYGVDSHTGKRSYMPKYPKQKMSNQQVEDLKAYFKSVG